MPRARRRFVLCVSNKGYAASLEPRKLYVCIPDAEAGREGLLRIVDESGEDYLYTKDYFAEIVLPRRIEQALTR